MRAYCVYSSDLQTLLTALKPNFIPLLQVWPNPALIIIDSLLFAHLRVYLCLNKIWHLFNDRGIQNYNFSKLLLGLTNINLRFKQKFKITTLC